MASEDIVDVRALAIEISKLSREIRPLLAGRDRKVTGGVLADLMALWLAGHFANDKKETARMRKTMLKNHVALIESLVPMNEVWLLKTQREREPLQ